MRRRIEAQAGADLMVAVAVVAGVIRFDVNHFIITRAAAGQRLPQLTEQAPQTMRVVSPVACSVPPPRVNGVSPPAASAGEPRAVDFSSARRLAPIRHCSLHDSYAVQEDRHVITDAGVSDNTLWVASRPYPSQG